MSVETYLAVEEAIAAHVADECEHDLVGGWVVVAETTNLSEYDDGVSSFFTARRSGQSNFLTTGLLYRALEVGQMGSDD